MISLEPSKIRLIRTSRSCCSAGTARSPRARSDSGAEQSYLQQLRRRFPDSPQAQELLERRP